VVTLFYRRDFLFSIYTKYFTLSKEFHIYDSDVDDYIKEVNEMVELNDGRRTGLNTNLREMENYIPNNLIETEFNIETVDNKDEWKEKDVPKFLRDKVFLNILDINKREQAIKGILNKTLASKLTKEYLEVYGVYDEIESWFKKISEFSKL